MTRPFNFSSAAAIVCGALIAWTAPAIDALSHVSTARFWFFSPERLARNIQNKGYIELVSGNDSDINFTDMNYTGKLPSKNSAIVYVSFGKKPVVRRIVLNHEAFTGYKSRIGATPVSLIRVAVNPDGTTTVRPDVPTTESNPPSPKLT